MPETSPATGDDPAVGRRRGSYAKGVARRQEILDRALEVFQDRGDEGTSLRRIAETIGVSHATLLHYFASREELLLAVYAHAEARRGMDDELGPVGTMVDAATKNAHVPGMVQLYSTLLAGSLQGEESPSRDFFTARFAEVRSYVADMVRARQAEGEIRADLDADGIASLLIAASDGLQIQWLLEPGIDLERTLEMFGPMLRP
ncbi:TetR/AcrR family transcriptional regulator [Brachybacterium sp. ACRRE]|uniref:TetR/AcrR family transcriptional regulator n=1 Tax=Brachybacterium sp. ACRRE TaxID=2918184 RepID=UPI001EF2A1C8|nr:TetR/AcrR family transcriptional regulator [Brachybacterium sp. ACRRE]MCG7310155.1 TetR/AcrR family transcriptional regulator [Brachybacterium sp. ACRRE]